MILPAVIFSPSAVVIVFASESVAILGTIVTFGSDVNERSMLSRGAGVRRRADGKKVLGRVVMVVRLGGKSHKRLQARIRSRNARTKQSSNSTSGARAGVVSSC